MLLAFLRRLLCCQLILWAWMPCALRAQDWTPQDSLRLQRMLDTEGEIKLNPQALKELERSFGQPQASDDKPWMEFDETLPGVPSEKEKKARMTLYPYSPTTPYNWDPIRQCKIDIDKPRWIDNILRGSEAISAGAPSPSGHSFMEVFTKEFWNRNIKKRRRQTLETLRAYGDSISVHYREKARDE